MKKTILKFISDRFTDSSSIYKIHNSSCYYPWENCTCNNLNSIDYDTFLLKSGIIDSFSLAILIIFLEKTFNVKISEKNINDQNFNTINDIYELILKLKK